MNFKNRNYFFIFLFACLLLSLWYLERGTLMEPLENRKTDKNDCTLKAIDENTKDINTLREQIKGLDLKPVEKRIQQVNDLISANTDALKDVAKQSQQGANQSINMDVREDGNVYDENGKPIYEEEAA